MFEDRTAEKLLQEVLEAAPDGIDVREGSIYYDAVAGVIQKHARFYAELSEAFSLIFLPTSVGEYLDLRASTEFRLTRNEAVTARYEFEYEGKLPEEGMRFFADSLYFKLVSDDGMLLLEAEEGGVAYNHIQDGTAAVPERTISGLTAARFGKPVRTGVDTESDDSYRKRVQEKLSGPAENGNRQHYKTWCEDISGVGRARIIPLFAGENTVMGVLFDAEGQPADNTLVVKVQEHIDPITKNLTVEYQDKPVVVGDGLGNGVANIGAHFAAVPAESRVINVSFTAVLASSAALEQLQDEATAALTAHLKELALTSSEDSAVILRISTVGALLYSLESLIDYSNLQFNGETANVEIGETEAPVLGEVQIDLAV